MTQFTAPTIIIVQPVYVVVRVWRFSARGQNVSLIPPPPPSLGSKMQLLGAFVWPSHTHMQCAQQWEGPPSLKLPGKYYCCSFEIGYLSFFKGADYIRKIWPRKVVGFDIEFFQKVITHYTQLDIKAPPSGVCIIWVYPSHFCPKYYIVTTYTIFWYCIEPWSFLPPKNCCTMSYMPDLYILLYCHRNTSDSLLLNRHTVTPLQSIPDQSWYVFSFAFRICRLEVWSMPWMSWAGGLKTIQN